MSRGKTMDLILVLLSILSFTTSALAMSEEDRKVFMKLSEEERTFLLLYFNEDELYVVSSTRSLKSISRVAENVEVVTASDIELMNAHTLVDVLNTINGVQIAFTGAGPGSTGMAQIQGSSTSHVVVLVDGVNINDIAGGVPPTELIPVQMIEKVEVIKGPASSAWGSSLGGIINVITKTPATGSRPNGMISGSYGERNTGDFKAELTGKSGSFGYYLFGGRLQTDGLRPRDDSWHNSLYSKFTYDITKDTSAALTFFYNKSEEAGGDFDASGFRFDTRFELMLSSLTVKSRLSNALSVEASVRMLSKTATGFITDLPSGVVTEIPGDDKKYGGSIKFDLRQGMHNIVFGADYDINKTKFSRLTFDGKIAAAYVNDTISWGRLSVIPGLRFDSIDINGNTMKENFLSPSLGLTYEIAEKTLLRAVVARGFSVPPVFALTSDSPWFVKNPALSVEKVWSYQAGLETGALKYLWLKVGAFRHDITDAIQSEDVSVDDGTWTFVNKNRMRRQGVEAAIRTLPFHNVTLTAAACYIKSKNLQTGEVIKDNPTYTYNVGIQYDDKKSLRALIHGYHIWWNSTEGMNAKYNAFIVDANVIKTLYKKEPVSVEAFLTGHNLFNGSSYWLENYKNARRWIEAGLRVKF